MMGQGWPGIDTSRAGGCVWWVAGGIVGLVVSSAFAGFMLARLIG